MPVFVISIVFHRDILTSGLHHMSIHEHITCRSIPQVPLRYHLSLFEEAAFNILLLLASQVCVCVCVCERERERERERKRERERGRGRDHQHHYLLVITPF
jgi:hypothetical protein